MGRAHDPSVPELGFTVDLPATNAVAARFLLLPLHTALSDDDADDVCDQIEAFYRQGHKATNSQAVVLEVEST